MKLQEMLNDLNEFTAPPKDGDYDAHTINAMIAVFNYCNPKHTTPLYEERIKDLEEKNKELLYYQEQWRKIGGAANLKHLVEENKKLRECLEFYADEGNWSDPIGYYECVELDGGEEARKCLAELKKDME